MLLDLGVDPGLLVVAVVVPAVVLQFQEMVEVLLPQLEVGLVVVKERILVDLIQPHLPIKFSLNLVKLVLVVAAEEVELTPIASMRDMEVLV